MVGTSSLDQSYLHALFEHSPEAIVVLDREGKILSANPRFQKMFGYATEEILGSDIDHLVVPERLRHEAKNLNLSALVGMETEHQTTRRRKDGTTLPVSILAAPILHEGNLVAFYSIYRDLSALRDAEWRLAQTQTRLDAILSQAPIVLFTLDTDAVFTFCAGKAMESAGLTVQESIGQSAYDLFKGIPEMPAAIGQTLKGERVSIMVTFRGLTYEVQFSPILDADGAVDGVLGLAHDVTEMQLARKQLEFMAHHDILTGLPNRALFHDRVQEALHRAKRRNTKVALLFLDLDRFKQVNDTLGHQTGDRLLKWVAHTARGAVRDMDTVARFGGDEFAVLVEDIDTTLGAAAVAQRLLDGLNQPYEDAGHPITTGASLGISLYPDDGLDAETLLKQADIAMYRAKNGGRGYYEFFSKDMSEAATAIFTKTAWMRHALEHDGFVLHYQPTINLQDGCMTGVEALIRLRQPDGILMPPLEFIALAEETGLIIPIGRWVVHEACRQWKAWQAEHGLNLRMAINLSAREFHDDAFVRTIGDTLEAHAVPTERFMVEITESMMFPDLLKAHAMLGELRDMKIAVAIDDFGTGYSSLAHLKDFPANYIKIDQSFVAGVPADERTCGIVRTIVAMAKNLNLGVIAEGVETEAQRSYLQALDCDEAQGFLFGAPTEAQILSRRLDKRAKPDCNGVDAGH
ncbi:response regulator receiver modulated diguanylate cyclase/phosphodiesterase with PAS/PAC sensor(s) [mine drainage metagenome]|uniref:Response regulator receiver modulated diguanylate cyclase/phosphodiesterase with PAS/PAC sensor(S) n=1 Tax=mine drainage metagenome TaxID=410659 RepID=T1CLU1_9ZZZZ